MTPRELCIGRNCTLAAVGLSILTFMYLFLHLQQVIRIAESIYAISSIWLFHISVAVLLIGNIAYLFCRYGYYMRNPRTEYAPQDQLDRVPQGPADHREHALAGA